MAAPKKPARKKPPVLKAAARVVKPVRKLRRAVRKAPSRPASRPDPHIEQATAAPPDADSAADPALDPVQPAPDQLIDEAAVQLRAYQLWESAGRPDGDGAQFWHAARQALIKEQQRGR
ncbi:MAG: DUF2934 domain-containing protein [Planctomycetia bacterium]|nr:DUF2934 domain-containing protein [Planctomycetia bacterium]